MRAAAVCLLVPISILACKAERADDDPPDNSEVSQTTDATDATDATDKTVSTDPDPDTGGGTDGGCFPATGVNDHDYCMDNTDSTCSWGPNESTLDCEEVCSSFDKCLDHQTCLGECGSELGHLSEAATAKLEACLTAAPCDFESFEQAMVSCAKQWEADAAPEERAAKKGVCQTISDNLACCGNDKPLANVETCLSRVGVWAKESYERLVVCAEKTFTCSALSCCMFGNSPYCNLTW